MLALLKHRDMIVRHHTICTFSNLLNEFSLEPLRAFIFDNSSLLDTILDLLATEDLPNYILDTALSCLRIMTVPYQDEPPKRTDILDEVVVMVMDYAKEKNDSLLIKLLRVLAQCVHLSPLKIS